MREIKNINVYEYAKEIDSLYQDCSQYDNASISLWKINKAVIMIDDDAASKTYFLLDKNEKKDAIENPEKFLKEQAEQWIINCDYPADLERLRWNLVTTEEVAAKDKSLGAYNIIEIGCFYGYSPVNFVCRDEYGYNNDNPILFSTYQDADEWIEENTKGPYYLSNNEAGSPDYIIVEA